MGFMLIIFSSGCAGWFCSKPKPKPKSKIVYVIKDDSGDFQKQHQSCIDCIAPAIANNDKNLSCGVTGAVRGDDFFAYALITDRAKDSDTIIAPTKINYESNNGAKKKAARAKLIADIRNTPNSMTYGTDVYGALYQASVVLSDKAFDDYDKYLLIYSNMGDTANVQTKEIKLTGVKVRVMFFTMPSNEAEKAEWTPDETRWRTQFEAMGVTDIKIKNPALSISTNPFQ
jgi:hypothetical protein